MCPRHAEIARPTRDGLWACGQRKSVAHMPTGPTTTATSFNLMNAKNGQNAYRGGQQTHCTQLYADPDNHSQEVHKQPR
jgi:hypothetical protein